MLIFIKMLEQERKVKDNEAIQEKIMLHKKTYKFFAKKSCVNSLEHDTCGMQGMYYSLLCIFEKYFIPRLKQYPISNKIFKNYVNKYFIPKDEMSWELQEMKEEYIELEKKKP